MRGGLESIKYTARAVVDKKTGRRSGLTAVAPGTLDLLAPSALGIGDLRAGGKRVEAIAVIFDLEGFTEFSGQNDPQLMVPEFLQDFLDWLFAEIRKCLIKRQPTEEKPDYLLHSRLPFYAKFLGDGVLLLWDTNEMSDAQIGNVVQQMRKVCRNYREEFFRNADFEYTNAPSRLRCGIARGQVVSVGKGNSDYIGPCINLASRLQKVGPLGFAFSVKGIKRRCFVDPANRSIVVVKASVRGSSAKELIGINKWEFDALTDDQKADFEVVPFKA